MQRHELPGAYVLLGETPVLLDVADSARKQIAGLQGVHILPTDRGVLFTDLTSHSNFHMVNVHCPLCIAFLDKDNIVLESYEMEPWKTGYRAPLGTRQAIECHPLHRSALKVGTVVEIVPLEPLNLILAHRDTDTVAVDFDGVIHKYSEGYKDGSIYDEPIEGAIEGLKKLLSSGKNVVIFTARPNIGEAKEYLVKHDPTLKSIQVTNTKPPAEWYIDDKAIHFTSWEQILHQLLSSDSSFD